MQSLEGKKDLEDDLPRAQNYIYGQFEDTDTYIDSYEPSTGKVWALIPNSNGKKYYSYEKIILLPPTSYYIIITINKL